MIQAKRSLVKCGDWFTRISHFELCNRVSVHPSVSLNNDKICREFSEHKIAVCGSTEWELFGFELSVLERVSSRRNISILRHALQTEQYRDSTDGLKITIVLLYL